MRWLFSVENLVAQWLKLSAPVRAEVDVLQADKSSLPPVGFLAAPVIKEGLARCLSSMHQC